MTSRSKKRVTRGKAIRLRCLDCCGESFLEVRECPARRCALWPYRLGHGWQNPSDPPATARSGPQERTEATRRPMTLESGPGAAQGPEPAPSSPAGPAGRGAT